MLNTRPKWTAVVKDLKKGDVVLVLDKDLPRGRWKLGRIVETYPGPDGHTRVAKIHCGDKTVVRPIHKLIPLQDGQNHTITIFADIFGFVHTAFSQCGEGECSAGRDV